MDSHWREQSYQCRLCVWGCHRYTGGTPAPGVVEVIEWRFPHVLVLETGHVELCDCVGWIPIAMRQGKRLCFCSGMWTRTQAYTLIHTCGTGQVPLLVLHGCEKLLVWVVRNLWEGQPVSGLMSRSRQKRAWSDASEQGILAKERILDKDPKLSPLFFDPLN